MFDIVENDISLTRGDTLILTVIMKRKEDDEPYTPQAGERVRFAMKNRYTDPDDAVLILKEIPIDTMILEIEPEDTKPLKFNKTYVYDIEYTDILGHVDTFIKGTFKLTEEVL